MLGNGGRWCRWTGQYSDADVATWTREFETALGTQLHVRHKQKPANFYLSAELAASLFPYARWFIWAGRVTVLFRGDGCLVG